MILDEARLKTHVVTREVAGSAADSGLSTQASPETFEIAMDLQAAGTPVFANYPDYKGFVGGAIGFTYDDRLQLGDRLYDTPMGALRVERIEAWDDEEPMHYEIGLVPA